MKNLLDDLMESNKTLLEISTRLHERLEASELVLINCNKRITKLEDALYKPVRYTGSSRLQ